jgi:hypothetical protein
MNNYKEIYKIIIETCIDDLETSTNYLLVIIKTYKKSLNLYIYILLAMNFN